MWRIWAVAAVIGVALVAWSCFGPASQVCQNGGSCPAGFHCTASGDSCVPADSRCGNGVRDPGEACDDGNVRAGDGCSPDCRSNETCGNGILDPGEVCDDGNTISGDGCSANCLSVEGCGNGRIDLGEECDDGNLANDDNCPSTCKVWFCGDGFVNDAGHQEQCDDRSESAQCNANCTWSRCGDQILNRTAGEECDLGMFDTQTCTHLCKLSFCGDRYVNGDAGEVCDDQTVGATSCPYGVPTCLACNATCIARVTLAGPYCGDNNVDPLPDGGVEQCDDSSRNWTACPYGSGTCQACNSTCTLRTLTGPYCGDGVVTNVEVCDDGNNLACGTCSANCGQSQPGASATGAITPPGASSLVDGETFTLNDGVNTEVFEFDTLGNGGASGHVVVPIQAGAGNLTVVSDISSAINGERNAGRLTISATKNGNAAILTNTIPGVSGNQPITETVANTGFTVAGMSGGSAFDCGAGVGCISNTDCTYGLTCLPADGGTGNTCQ